MEIEVIGEYGYEQAMLGISLSFNSTIEKSYQVAKSLAHKQGGHNKFLESIQLWIDVDAPRDWWQNADTYRLSTKQSESTMHTITKRLLNQDDFENDIYACTLVCLNYDIALYQRSVENELKDSLSFNIKNNLPEGFLQRRIWNMSYKCLQNIYNQRKNHKLPQWHRFLDTVLSQIEHPEFIIKPEKETTMVDST